MIDEHKEEIGVEPLAGACDLSDRELVEELSRRIEISRETVAELQALNEELHGVNEKLKESEALKSHFISNITNEIINPFTSIIGLSRSILSVDKEGWKKVISMVALIHSEAFNLDFQFRNIFFAAKFEAGEEQPSITNSDLIDIIQSTIEGFKYELRKRKHEVRLTLHLESGGYDSSGNFPYKTDASYVRLVLSNLLSNAINFSTEPRSTIEVGAHVDGDRRFTLTVRDYGVGIYRERQADIFDRFIRADNTISSVSRGHGLGLSVCRAITEMLDGRLEVESSLGSGALFIFSIPESEELTDVYADEGDGIFFDTEETF